MESWSIWSRNIQNALDLLVHCFFHQNCKIRERKDFIKDEFKVPEGNKVAEYDSEELTRFWLEEKKNVLERKNVIKQIFAMWSTGIWRESRIPIYLYLIAYYIVNISIIQTGCHENYISSNNTTSYFESVKIYGCLYYKEIIEKLDDKQHEFTKLITFLLGFYVSFTLGRWWKKITCIPEIEEFCLTLNSFIWVDPDKNESEIYVKEGVTVKQFKYTLTRYLLLSWSMVLSTIRGPLETKLRNPIDFNKKGLLTPDEYIALNANDSKETWKMKWTTSISWAVSMLSEAIEKTKDNKRVKIKEHKEIIGSIRRFEKMLRDILYFEENPTPDLTRQAIQAAIVFWMVFGVFSSQELINQESNVSLGIAMIMDFPLRQIIVYVLILGWLKTAFIFQNPFGFERYVNQRYDLKWKQMNRIMFPGVIAIFYISLTCRYDVNLPVILDTQIWTASTLLNEKIPYNRCNFDSLAMSDNENFKAWKEFGINWIGGAKLDAQITHPNELEMNSISI